VLLIIAGASVVLYGSHRIRHRYAHPPAVVAGVDVGRARKGSLIRKMMGCSNATFRTISPAVPNRSRINLASPTRRVIRARRARNEPGHTVASLNMTTQSGGDVRHVLIICCLAATTRAASSRPARFRSRIRLGSRKRRLGEPGFSATDELRHHHQ
jgi:hypothetical protein